MSKVLITGGAGFIGFHLTKRLLSMGFEVVSIDNMNEYYSVDLKYDRIKQFGVNRDGLDYNVSVSPIASYSFIKLDLTDRGNLHQLFDNEQFDYVINLAAQAGVRYSIENPYTYEKNNIDGFLNILEGCRNTKVKHLLYASSSSVYGLNSQIPFKESHATEHPISLYAASKKANEMMAHTYSYLYGIPTSGLRFFTVYGPWGRPDMALFLFTKAMLEEKPIEVFNHGEMLRDFTYVEDIVEGVTKLIPHIPTGVSQGILPSDYSTAPYSVYNIGNGSPVPLMDFVHEIEKNIGCKVKIDFKPLQPGDVPKTYADTSKLEKAVGYKSKTSVPEGIKKFYEWYKGYFLD